METAEGSQYYSNHLPDLNTVLDRNQSHCSIPQGLLRLLPLIRIPEVHKKWHSMCLCRDKEEKNHNKSSEHKET